MSLFSPIDNLQLPLLPPATSGSHPGAEFQLPDLSKAHLMEEQNQGTTGRAWKTIGKWWFNGFFMAK